MYVLSAVRTPIGLLNGFLSEFCAAQLSAIIIRESLERSVVPVDDVEKFFIGCALDSNFDSEIIKRLGVRKSTKFLGSKCSLQSFVIACQSTQHHKKAVIAAGVESMSNNYLLKEQNSVDVNKMQLENDFRQKLTGISNFIDKHSNFNQDYAIRDELAKINFRKKGHQITVTEDEQIKGSDLSQKMEGTSLLPGDGASATVVASEEYVNKNLLTPLAEVISFVSAPVKTYENDQLIIQTIQKAVGDANMDCQSISMWEINPLTCNVLSCINHLEINPSLVNKYNSLFNKGHPVGMYGGKMISQVIHSLSPGEFGCVAGLSIDGISSAVVFKKLCSKISTKPELILYTKKSCQLCDDLERQLEQHKDRFSLQKIDIELDENIKLKTLYSYEIPVLFLDGVFLCKHRLDLDYFISRLEQSEEIVVNNKNE